MRSIAPGSRMGPRHECNLRYLSGVAVRLLPLPSAVRACRKLQLAMQEQDTILEDGQAGHVDGLGGGSQTAASLPVTEGKERTKASWCWRSSPKQAQAGIDLEASGTLNFAEVDGPAWSIHVPGGPSLMCPIRHCQPTAERQRTTGPAQGNPTVVDCWLWIADSGDTEPQEVFLVLQRCWTNRSTSRLAAVKLARVRSHFHITQPDQPGG